MVNVIIVDDHALFRLGIKGILESSCPDIYIAGEAPDGKTLFQLLLTTSVDVILLDIGLPDMNGIEIARRLREDYPQIKILIVSVENNADTVQKLLEIGIEGFISKQQTSKSELPEAIYSIMNGMEYFGRDIASIIYNVYISKKKTTKMTSEFTEREQQIIELCRLGLQSKEVADRLNISFRTVDVHKKNIFRKLGINNTMEMVQYALQNGIIQM